MQRSPSVCSSSTEGPHFNPTILQSSCKTCCPGTPDPSVMEDSLAGRSSHSFLRFKRVWMKKVTPATPGSSDQISVGGKPGITEVTMVSVPCACLLTNTRFLAPISCLCQERCPPSTLPHRVSGRYSCSPVTPATTMPAPRPKAPVTPASARLSSSPSPTHTTQTFAPRDVSIFFRYPQSPVRTFCSKQFNSIRLLTC